MEIKPRRSQGPEQRVCTIVVGDEASFIARREAKVICNG